MLSNIMVSDSIARRITGVVYLSVVDVTELAAQQGCQAFRFLHGAVDDLCCPVKRMLRSMSKRWNGSHRPYGINGYRGD